jgi:hypothetical protein
MLISSLVVNRDKRTLLACSVSLCHSICEMECDSIDLDAGEALYAEMVRVREK